MRLFEKEETNSYAARKISELKAEISAFSDEQIVTCNFDEWADYFVSKYNIAPIILYLDNVEKSMQETKIEQYNVWSRTDPYEPEYYKIDGYEITFYIPFDGDSALFHLMPMTRILDSFDVDSIENPKGDSLGRISLALSYTASDLKNKNNVNDLVHNGFTNKFKKYETMIGYVNAEITSFNAQLHDLVLKLLEDRKSKANDFASLSQALKIPMKRNPNAPNTVPIPLKRVAKKPVNKPQEKLPPTEYSISDADYKNIVNIIHMACASMEATPNAFAVHGEEELRDFILATLNTHYEATGETFRKVGKTDIHITFDSKAAFIGECKIWYGIKKFEEAIEQLFGYSTWKDTKTAIIVFNKNVKDFSSVQNNVLEWIGANAARYTRVNNNVIDCTIHRDDKNIDVNVSVQLYDLN